MDERAFERARQRTLSFEAGESNSRIDRGGHTFRGITQHLYDAWRKKHGLPSQSVILITESEHRLLSHEEFWLPCRCDELPEPLAFVVFDMAFNSGPGDAIKALQRAVHAVPDGQFGPITMSAVRIADGPLLPLRVLEQRMAHIQEVIADDPPQVGNLEGWGIRLLKQAWSHGA